MKSEVLEKPCPDEMRLSAQETTSGSAVDVVLSNQTTGQSFVSQSEPNSDTATRHHPSTTSISVPPGMGMVTSPGS